MGTVLGGAGDECRAEPHLGGRIQVAVVSGDEHDLAGAEVEERRVAQIGVGEWLVGVGGLGAQDHVPGQPAVPGEAGEQADVAVGERPDDESFFQPGEACHGVGPRVEAVPGTGEVVEIHLRERGDSVPLQDPREALAVQEVEDRPLAPTGPDLLHRGLVLAAPLVGDPLPVCLEAMGGAERGELADDAGPPIDDGPEHVEEQGNDCGPAHRTKAAT